MKTDLDYLLESIDPSRNLDDLAARADEALNTFGMTTGAVSQWEEFVNCMSRFFCHLENHLLSIHPPREEDRWMDWGRSLRALYAEYGEHGEQAAFDIARTGEEGGLYAVLKAVARHQANEYAMNEIRARVSAYMRGLSVDERLDATREYLQKHGHLLPSALTEDNAPRIAAGFYKTLTEHPRVVQRLRRVTR